METTTIAALTLAALLQPAPAPSPAATPTALTTLAHATGVNRTAVDMTRPVRSATFAPVPRILTVGQQLEAEQRAMEEEFHITHSG